MGGHRGLADAVCLSGPRETPQGRGRRQGGACVSQAEQSHGRDLYSVANPDRSPLPEQPDVPALVKDYKGSQSLAEGEVFAATIENVEKRTTRSALSNGMKLALLPKKTRGGAVKLSLAFHFAKESDLK